MTNRLKKEYEDLIEELSQDTDTRYKQYLLRKPRTVAFDRLVLDIEHLDSYFRCAGCKTRKPRAFCCSCHELELTDKDVQMLEMVRTEVASLYPRLAALLEKHGGFFRYNENFERIMIQKSSGDCIFLIPGGDGCYLHRYALEHGIDPVDVKPYICSLYPLVVIIVGDDAIITTMNQDSARILETGDNTACCLSKKGKPEDHVVLKSEAIIRRMFGDKVYERIAGAVGIK